MEITTSSSEDSTAKCPQNNAQHGSSSATLPAAPGTGSSLRKRSTRTAAKPSTTATTNEDDTNHNHHNNNDGIVPVSSAPAKYSVRYYKEYHNDDAIPILQQDLFPNHDRLKRLVAEGHTSIQILVLFVNCFLTYTINTNIECINANLAQALTICWACAAYPQLSASAAAGSIAGMTELLDDVQGKNANYVVYYQYGWLFLFASITAIIWIFGFHRYKLLVGFSGRLGMSVFPAECLVQGIMILCSNGVPSLSAVSWSSFGSRTELWSNSVLVNDNWKFITMQFGGIFINTLISGYIFTTTRMPLNPIQIPTNITVFVMLWKESIPVLTGQYRYYIGQGLCIGSFVAMGSTDKYLPSLWDYVLAGFWAGVWGLFWIPFCKGFGGKLGMIACCGFSTYILLKKMFWSLLIRCGWTGSSSSSSSSRSNKSNDDKLEQTPSMMIRSSSCIDGKDITNSSDYLEQQ